MLYVSIVIFQSLYNVTVNLPLLETTRYIRCVQGSVLGHMIVEAAHILQLVKIMFSKSAVSILLSAFGINYVALLQLTIEDHFGTTVVCLCLSVL